MANVLFVTYHFAPENTSGTHRSLHFARALTDAGHQVSVIAGPQPSPHRSDTSLDMVFPWPDRVQRVAPGQTIGGLYLRWKQLTAPKASGRAAREPPPAAATNGVGGVLARLRHHLRVWEALPDHQRSWGRPAIRAGIAWGRRHRAETVFASGPPWTGLMVGHRVARALGVPLIADFRDPWTDGTGATWRYGAEWAHRRVARWEAGVLAAAAMVCFNSPRLAAITAARHTLAAAPLVILNGSDVARQPQTTRIPTSQPLQFRHFGTLYAGRRVLALVRGLEELIGAGAVRPDEVVVELVGDHDLSPPEVAQLMSSPVSITLAPHLPFAEASRRMRQPSVLVCVQSAQHASLIPTKLFDYLCTGNPIVVLSPHASASWDVVTDFSRCHRLDLEPSPHNRDVLSRLITTWRAGKLEQQASVTDTASLGKEPLGAQFVRAVEAVIGGYRL
jgi:hypothetical protein